MDPTAVDCSQLFPELRAEQRSDHAGEAGAVAALAESNSVYATVVAVERFVVEHYRTQIDMLENWPELAELRKQLRAFQQDEASDRADAHITPSPPMRSQWKALWPWIFDRGSRFAVMTAKRI